MFFGSNIPLYIRKIYVEKLCKASEMELKTNIPAGLKFVFEKIKFKFLHYILHDFIRQHPGLSKDQISMFKSLFINYFIFKYCHTFQWLYKRWQIFLFYISSANIPLKLNYLQSRVKIIQKDHICHTKQYQKFYRKIKCDLWNFRGVKNEYHQDFQFLFIFS